MTGPHPETLTPTERAALEELATAIRARFGGRVVKLALYGSRARGDVHEDSDIDVLVVLRGRVGLEERSAITRLACDIALAAPAFAELSPRTLSEDEYARLLREEWRLALDVEREGIPL